MLQVCKSPEFRFFCPVVSRVGVVSLSFPVPSTDKAYRILWFRCNLAGMEYFGLAMFKFQCYFLTHLIFMAANGIEVDCWSDVRLDAELFAEVRELFLCAMLRVSSCECE